MQTPSKLISIVCILRSSQLIFLIKALGYCSPVYTQLEVGFNHCYVRLDPNWITYVYSLDGRKRKAWARRRRQSGTKPSLKTVPKEDDSDDACNKRYR